MQQRKAAAVGACQLVVWQPLKSRFALIIITDKARSQIGLQSPLGHETRGDRQVAIRCDVPVIRYRHFLPALDRAAKRRGEEAGFALGVERERHARRGQYIQTLEIQLGAFGFADITPVVELELLYLQVPVVIAWPAGGVDRVIGLVIVFAEEIHFSRSAAGAVVRQEVIGFEKKPGLRIE